MTWQSGLPRVATIAQSPCSVTPRNWCGCAAARPAEMRIVDETLPAHRGARLLEIDAHHDTEIARVLVGQDAQAPPVVERGGRVVDRARSDDHDEPVVLASEDAADVAARAGDRLGAA